MIQICMSVMSCTACSQSVSCSLFTRMSCYYSVQSQLRLSSLYKDVLFLQRAVRTSAVLFVQRCLYATSVIVCRSDLTSPELEPVAVCTLLDIALNSLIFIFLLISLNVFNPASDTVLYFTKNGRDKYNHNIYIFDSTTLKASVKQIFYSITPRSYSIHSSAYLVLKKSFC